MPKHRSARRPQKSRAGSPDHQGRHDTPQRQSPALDRQSIVLLREGIQLHRLGQLHQAAAHYRKILERDPSQTDALLLLGSILVRHDPGQAVTLLHKAAAARPQSPDVHLNLGHALHATSELDAARRSFRRALQLKPGGFPEALMGLAGVCQSQGNLAEAEDYLRRALALQPDSPDLLQRLADTQKAMGRFGDARDSYQRALEIAPGHLAARLNLANLLAATGDASTALDHYHRALADHADVSDAHYNLGTLLSALNRNHEAVTHLQQAIRLNPNHALALNNLGGVLLNLQQLSEAEEALNKALALKPDFLDARDNLIATRMKLADWQDLSTLREALLEPALQDIEPQVLRPFAMLGLPTPVSPAEQQKLIRAYAQRETHRLQTAEQRPFQHATQPPRKHLRIAYLSSDFRNHATSHLIQGLFSHHDRQHLQVICYSTGMDDHSSQRHRIATTVDAFHDLQGSSWSEVAERIHGDGIDILVDLNGFTTGDRFPALTLRPAPIQVSYLGFPGTLGSHCVDYLIADAVVIPPGEEQFYDESVVRMPYSYQVNDRDRPIGETPTRRDCGLPENATVFSCFCNTYKLEPMIFAVWMRILHRVSGSVLWLLGKNPTAEKHLRTSAATQGIDPGRLIFAQPVPHAEHLARHRLADLALDTHYYNGHTTTSDALWAGLPVITLPGGTFASRVSLSLLKAVGLEELAVADATAFEDLAVHLASHSQALADLKSRLAAHRLDAPLFDTARFARDLERAFAIMWDRHSRGEAPRGFDLSPQA